MPISTAPGQIKSPAHVRRPLGLLLAIAWILLVLPGTRSASAQATQSEFPDPRAQALLEQLSPAERIGQLFLVSFNGTQINPESPIYDLIVRRHIGGVVLSKENDNFTGSETVLGDALSLARQLQVTEWDASQADPTDSLGEFSEPPQFIPLFIGLSQEGNGYPYDQILSGLTPQPSLLSIGATWQPDLAQAAGEALGRELKIQGINLILGPSLDVLDNSTPDIPAELGTRSFGGDPFWVGLMGQAYITGLHQGGEGRLAVVGKHFPGLGGSDRLPTEEVATVRKSLEQLKQIELAPFFDVTGAVPGDEGVVDALLTSHIRYQGFQGNIRATTSPISFDPQAFELLMSLEPLASWRSAGGVVISDELGSRAVRRFFETSGQTFDARLVARTAFLAGNDLLYLGNFVADESLDRYTTTVRILDSFTQKYQEDSAFKERVDQSVLRILNLKYRLYADFTLDTVLPPIEGLEELIPDPQIPFAIASRAATLISPDPTELDNVLPNPPEPNDRFIIFTDTYNVRQCSTCPEAPILPVDSLQAALVKLYGPEAGAQIQPYNLPSFSTEALTGVLDAGIGDSLIERTTRQAEWIVFAILNEDPNRPASLALRRFLEERPDLYRQKKLIVFAFDAPYFLDATDIVKLTAYFGLYSKTPAFVDIAARLLFKELRPIPGALPLSVPGIGYDLISATSPDPGQAIELSITDPPLESPGEDGTPAPPLLPDLKVGDVITVQTGVIRDHNGNPVPDETPVQFIMSIGGLERPPQVETTVQGASRTSFVINAAGPVSIIARSGEPPAISNPIQLEIPAENGGTPEPTITVSPSPTTSPEPTATVELPAPTATPATPQPHEATDFTDWLLALVVALVASWSTYRRGLAAGHVRWGIRLGLCALIGGLLVYSYLSLQLPGASELLTAWGRWGVLFATLAGVAMGLGGGWGWRTIFRARRANGSR